MEVIVRPPDKGVEPPSGLRAGIRKAHRIPEDHRADRPDGERIKNLRKAWDTACKAAGCPGRIPHDFRRTAVRNLERVGVPRSAAMAMVGHKTEAIYRRYAIVDAGVLRDAAMKLDVAAGTLAGTTNSTATNTATAQSA
jgi:integrase